MKKTVGLLCLAIATAIPCVAVGPAPVHAGSITCKKKTSPNCGSGVAVTQYSGYFRVPVFHTHIVLRGKASPASHGTQIFAQRAVAPHTPAHAVAFRVFAVGHLPHLSLIGRGRLYAYSVAKNTWGTASAVTASGIYAAILK